MRQANFKGIVVTFSKPHTPAPEAIMEREKQYRHLHIPVRKPLRLMDRFAWLVGVSVAVLFLACVMMAYCAHRAR